VPLQFELLKVYDPMIRIAITQCAAAAWRE
jgi:hypothetical protein